MRGRKAAGCVERRFAQVVWSMRWASGHLSAASVVKVGAWMYPQDSWHAVRCCGVGSWA